MCSCSSRLIKWLWLLVSINFAQNPCHIIAYIEDTPIFYKDLTTKQAIAWIYGYDSVQFDLYAAFAQIVQELIEYHIARRYGIAPTLSQLDSLARQIDQRTKAPQRLQQIKALFQEDTLSYWQLFIRPLFVNNTLRRFFYFNSNFHQQQWRCMRQLLKAAFQGIAFKQLYHHLPTTCHSLHYQKLLFSDSLPYRTIVNSDFYVIPSVFAPSFLDSLSDSTLYPAIYEDERTLSLWKKISTTSLGIGAEVLSLDKSSFKDWLYNEATSLTFVFYDLDFYVHLQKRYSSLWWLSLFLRPRRDSNPRPGG